MNVVSVDWVCCVCCVCCDSLVNISGVEAGPRMSPRRGSAIRCGYGRPKLGKGDSLPPSPGWGGGWVKDEHIAMVRGAITMI